MVIIAKALSGGYYPISTVLSRREVLGVFAGRSRQHVRRQPAGLRGRPARRSRCSSTRGSSSDPPSWGAYFLAKLRTLRSPLIREIRRTRPVDRRRTDRARPSLLRVAEGRGSALQGDARPRHPPGAAARDHARRDRLGVRSASRRSSKASCHGRGCMKRIRTVIMGAAGRDFHNFNVVYRDDNRYEVVAFTAAQIPNIDGRRYPASLAGSHYPGGIPILAEENPRPSSARRKSTRSSFAYSDVPYTYVMARGSIVNSGRGQLQAAGRGRHDAREHQAGHLGLRRPHRLRQEPDHPAHGRHPPEHGLKVAAIRHPMPYGDPRSSGSSASRRLPTSRSTSARSRKSRSTNRTSSAARSSTRASTTATSWRRPEPRPTSSSGTAGTTTRPSIHRTCTSSSPIRCAPATSCCTTRARPTCGSRMWSSSTRQDTADIDAINALRQNIRRVNGRATHHRRRVADRRGSPRAHHRQAGARRRGRPDADARRDEVRRGRGGRQQVRRVGNRRPATVDDGDDQRHIPKVPEDRHPAARHGLRGQAGEGSRDDHQQSAVRHGHHRHADRPEPPDQDPEADGAGALRAAGDRQAGPAGCAEAVPEEEAEVMCWREDAAATDRSRPSMRAAQTDPDQPAGDATRVAHTLAALRALGLERVESPEAALSAVRLDPALWQVTAECPAMSTLSPSPRLARRASARKRRSDVRSRRCSGSSTC